MNILKINLYNYFKFPSNKYCESPFLNLFNRGLKQQIFLGKGMRIKIERKKDEKPFY